MSTIINSIELVILQGMSISIFPGFSAGTINVKIMDEKYNNYIMHSFSETDFSLIANYIDNVAVYKLLLKRKQQQ